jgi:hypothetical protein
MASNELERDLAASSVGFATKEDYKRKREELEHEKALKALKNMVDGNRGAHAGATAAAAPTDESSAPGSEKKRKKEKREKRRATAALSFGDELDAEPEPSPSLKPAKMGKCQDAEVGFLELNAREKAEAAARQEAAMREILLQQQRARNESIALQYTYRSELTQRELPGAVHKGSVVVRRGQTAEEVATAVRHDVEQLGGKFAPNQVQGIKEERDVLLVGCCAGKPGGSFIFPGAVSLVEIGTRRWADAQTSIFDDFAHGVVVTERRYYEAMRHTYPYSHWRQYESRDEYQLQEFVAHRNSAINPLEPSRVTKR